MGISRNAIELALWLSLWAAALLALVAAFPLVIGTALVATRERASLQHAAIG